MRQEQLIMIITIIIQLVRTFAMPSALWAGALKVSNAP